MEVIINEIGDDIGDEITATLVGRLDTVSAVQAEKDMQPLMAAAGKKITLQCEGLQYISSSGLRLLLTLRKAAAAQGGSVVLRGVSEEIKKILTITGFTSLFSIE